MKLKDAALGHAKLSAALFSLFFLLLQSRALAQTPFYQGKTITLVRGSTPGGIGELRVRALVPYLRKHIPGNPTVVMEFMPGGGGRKAANYVYGTARPDGVTIASIGGGLVESAILGETGVKYNLDKLILLGSSESQNHYVFMTRKEAGLDSMEKLQSATGVRVGAHAVGHTIYITGRLFAYFLGLKNPRFVTGYSAPEVDLALLRGEVDGRSQTSSSLLQRQREWIEKGLVHFHAVIEIPKGIKVPPFDHLPDLEKFARSEKERKLLAMFRSFGAAGSPYFVAPGTPKELVQILQTAFRNLFEDPEFHREYKKLTGVDSAPIKPEDHQKVFRELPRDPEIIELYKKLAGPEPLPPR